MAKVQEELTQLKNEYETLNKKLKELNEDELKMVTGGLYDGNKISYELDEVKFITTDPQIAEGKDTLKDASTASIYK